MIAGFTGTVAGATPAQLETLRILLEHYAPDELHHGASPNPKCADWQADALALELGIPTVHWPPTDGSGKAMMARNDQVVSSIEWLFATPRGYGEVLRSGTWATVRRGRKVGLVIALIWPNGDVTWE